MSLTAVDMKCPAAEEAHPVFSTNAMDVRCRVKGNLRDAKGSPCCGDYWTCPIWKREKSRTALQSKRLPRSPRMMGDDGRWVTA